MSNKLVLQGLGASQAALQAIAALARPSSTTPLGAHALRCDGVACTPDLKQAVDAAAFDAGVDATFIDAGRTLPDFGLVAMDMDSTLITIECIDEIADMQGLKPQVSAITEAAMRGELDFSASLTRRVALLEGLAVEALDRVYEERLRISPGGEAMLAAVQAAGLKTLLVSGGFTFFTEHLQKRLGLDYTRSNVLEIAGGKLTGEVIGDIVDAGVKRGALLKVRAELGLDKAQILALGDGANDLEFMAEAGVSVAYHAKPVVRAQATHAINYVGLEGVLNLFN
jgi:phosphoserine phosphatase